MRLLNLHGCAGTGAEQEAAALQALTPLAQQEGAKAPLCRWQKLPEGDGLELVHQHSVSRVTWHAHGDYFASVAPAGNTQVGCAATHAALKRGISTSLLYALQLSHAKSHCCAKLVATV